MVEIKKLLKKLLTATNISILLAAFSIVIMLYQIVLAKPGSLTIEWNPNEFLVPTERFSDRFVIVDICESGEFSMDFFLPRVSNKKNKTISNLNIDYTFISGNVASPDVENPLYDVSYRQVDGTYMTVFHYKANSLGPFASVQSPNLSSLKTEDHQSIRLELRVTHEGIRKPLQLCFEVVPEDYSGLNIKKLAEDNGMSQEESLSAIEAKLFKFVLGKYNRQYPLYAVVSSQAGESFIYDTKINPKRLKRFADNRWFKFNHYSIREFFEDGVWGYINLFLAFVFIFSTTVGFVVFLEDAINDFKYHTGWKNFCWALFLLCILVYMILLLGFRDSGVWYLLNSTI